MSRRNTAEGLGIASFNDIFGNNNVMDSDVPAEGQIVEVPLSELHTFANHPFRVLNDEKMEETIESIKKYGVLVPGIVRPRAEGGYEILSGHRRKHASELAGKETMPVIIKDVSDDESVIIMVDANIQREDILPSEKAKAYSMKYEAMKHQGTSGGLSLEEMGKQTGDAIKTIQRYISIARLLEPLLDMVDEKTLGLRVAVDISMLTTEEQQWVLDVIRETDCKISEKQSGQLKQAHNDGELNLALVYDVLSVEKKIAERKVVFKARKLDSYFAPNLSNDDIEDIIIKLLDEWKERGGDINAII